MATDQHTSEKHAEAPDEVIERATRMPVQPISRSDMRRAQYLNQVTCLAFIPLVALIATVFVTWGSHGIAGKDAEAMKAEAVHRIDLNHATQAELALLPGVGERLALKIVEARSVSPFESVDELDDRINGIGTSKLEQIKPHVFVSNNVEKP